MWFEHRALDMRNDGVTDSWDKFCDDLKTAFQPVTAHAMARDKLHRILQRESVQQYNSVFMKTITLVKDMTEDEKVDRYRRGLRPNLQREVMLANCTTLTHAMQVALKCEMVYDRTRRELPSNYSSSRRTFNDQPGYSSYRSYHDTAVPMEVNNISNGPRRHFGTHQGQRHVMNRSSNLTGFGDGARRNANGTYRAGNRNQNPTRGGQNSNNWRASGNGQPRRQ